MRPFLVVLERPTGHLDAALHTNLPTLAGWMSEAMTGTVQVGMVACLAKHSFKKPPWTNDPGRDRPVDNMYNRSAGIGRIRDGNKKR